MSDITHTGFVVWFDQKKGYGFVKILDSNSDFNGKDIFVHYSCIHVEESSYKKLFPGEYVSVDVKHQPDVEGKEYLCLNLTGVNGGKLLIESDRYNYKVFNKLNRDSGNPPHQGRVEKEGSDVPDEHEGGNADDTAP
jgi:cold shock CspA family protein